MCTKRLLLLLLVLLLPICATAEELVAAYEFTSDSGDFVTDTSGNALHGYIQGKGRSHFGTGFSGRGLVLNGVDNYVLVPDSTLFDLDQYTLMAWIKFKPNAWDREEVMEKAGAFWLNVRQDTQKLRTGGFFGGCTVKDHHHRFDSFKKVPVDKWTHVAVTYNGRILRIYINGILSGKSAVPAPGPVCSNIEPLSIGSKHKIIPPTMDAAFFFGRMDSVRIFDTALSATRIQQEMFDDQMTESTGSN